MVQTRGRNRFILYKEQDKMFSDDSYSVSVRPLVMPKLFPSAIRLRSIGSLNEVASPFSVFFVYQSVLMQFSAKALHCHIVIVGISEDVAD